MKSQITLALALGASLASISGMVWAKGGDCAPGMKERWQPISQQAWQERMQERVRAHFQRLETLLQLSEAQRPAWERFREEYLRTLQGDMPTGAPSDVNSTVLERMKQQEERLRQMQQRLEQQRTLIEAFYRQLTPAQQKIFDQEFRPHAKGRHHQHPPMMPPSMPHPGSRAPAF